MAIATEHVSPSSEPFAGSVSDRGRLCLRSHDGASVEGDIDRWLATPGPDEEAVLDLARGPVLDVGCGPGRHVLALARRGVMALGIDITPAAVSLARSRGALVLERSVFDRVPGKGRWGSALLLDGNVGIGGDATHLLRRLVTLLRPGGRVLLELQSPRSPLGPTTVRLEDRGRPGPSFGWAPVGVDQLEALTSAVDLSVATTWRSNGRWFAQLDRA